jgi:acyl-CoA reductase-like NAD-dependent aldehyde dehydrogenase
MTHGPAASAPTGQDGRGPLRIPVKVRDKRHHAGSTVTGKRIMEVGSATLKRVFLELGGKSAMLVLDDADFSTVIPAGSMVCMHAGQGCAMQTRMLLPRSRY